MASKKSKSLWDMKIVRRAAWDSVVKLHPVTMMRNPVMFVVEVGSVATTVLLIVERVHGRPGFGFNLQITLWLWFTVLFANFAEAMRSEEQTSELQSLRHLVCRLLLEKKKKKNDNPYTLL